MSFALRILSSVNAFRIVIVKVVAIVVLAVLAYYVFGAIGELAIWLLGGLVDNFILVALGFAIVLMLVSKK